MKKIRPYHIFLAVLLVLASACGNRVNDRITLWRNDKIPYGCWYAYNELQTIFPDAVVENYKFSPDRYRGYTAKDAASYEEAARHDHKKLAYVIITENVVPDNDEVEALLNLARQGKHVFISCMRPGENLLDSLDLKAAYSTGYNNYNDSLTVSVNSPLTRDSMSFTYPGKAIDNFIVEMDSTYTTILGKDQYGRANFVKFDYDSGGSFYLHLAPMAFTNFFLLHKNNKGYYDNAFSWMPKDIEMIRWDDYFRNHEAGDERNNNSNNSFSALGWIGKQQGLSTALWLLFILFVLVYLFESKRKQRIIPEIPPLKNASLEFVKTIGGLYFQRRDNKNLALKMMAHFMDHVRAKYNIRLSVTDEEFENRLAWKSGHDPLAIRSLMNQIKYVRSQLSVSDEALMDLNTRLENFYRTNT